MIHIDQISLAADVGLACLVLLYAGFCAFSVWWLLNTGELAALKPASWVGKVLYWHGALVFCWLVLFGPAAVMALLGAVLRRAWP